ncbi:MAG TPA: glucose 1-dehydrogenase [Acidimicrobiales bacterium]
MGRLDGKVALISGGARGQGAAEARLFAHEGAQVLIGDVLDADGHAVADSLGGAAAYQHLDVRSEADWEAFVEAALERWERVDVLINNAGIFRLGVLTQTSVEDWRLIMDINATGVFLGMRAVAPLMMEQRSGSIINISSIAGLRGSGVAIAYSSSKWAVRGMTKGAAQELAPYGVRVNSIHPGIIDTPMLQEFDAAGVRDAVRERIPMGREADAVEVARLALFLAADDSAYCTGSEFVVDGGMSM